MGSLIRYHDGQLILLETARNSLSFHTEKSEKFISSRLLLPRASSSDAGNYTCQPSEALSASVLVHVLHGDYKLTLISTYLISVQSRFDWIHCVCLPKKCVKMHFRCCLRYRAVIISWKTLDQKLVVLINFSAGSVNKFFAISASWRLNLLNLVQRRYY